MNSLRIPFGLHVETKKLVDVSSVPKGSACGCVCPSCHAVLEARQGRKNIWHFAHAKHTESSTLNVCQHSFGVSVRSMIRQLIPTIRRIMTWPNPTLKSGDRGHVIKIDSFVLDANLAGIAMDASLQSDSHTYFLFISHENRKFNPKLVQQLQEHQSIIRIDVECYYSIFEHDRNGNLKDCLVDLLENLADGTFIYGNNPLSKDNIESDHPSRQTYKSLWAAEQLTSNERYRFHCVGCGARWVGHALDHMCKNCRSPLLSLRDKIDSAG